ncbi:integrase core domain-containing protein, partial [Cellulosimicrobium arenosum]|uniref:integrase core domain-containing protein n=1 Tax=Cellulosimicrobium arenosum TaxID=2708133 RepID=UPI001F50A83B
DAPFEGAVEGSLEGSRGGRSTSRRTTTPTNPTTALHHYQGLNLVSAVQRRRDVAGCIVHSDRGSQFRSRKVRRVLDRHDLVGSMGQVASAGDNAAMESFFSLLQKNVLNRRRWTTREDLRLAIITWIERTYHRRRRQARLGRLTPIEYEAIMTTQVALAA